MPRQSAYAQAVALGEDLGAHAGHRQRGLAAAQAFVAEGARVIITGRDSSALAEAKAGLGASAIALRNDAGVVAEAKELAAALVS